MTPIIETLFDLQVAAVKKGVTIRRVDLSPGMFRDAEAEAMAVVRDGPVLVGSPLTLQTAQGPIEVHRAKRRCAEWGAER